MAKLNWERVRIQKLVAVRGSERIETADSYPDGVASSVKKNLKAKSKAQAVTRICPKCSARIKRAHLESHLKLRCPKRAITAVKPPVTIARISRPKTTTPERVAAQAIVLLRTLDESLAAGGLRAWTRSEMVIARRLCDSITEQFGRLLK